MPKYGTLSLPSSDILESGWQEFGHAQAHENIHYPINKYYDRNTHWHIWSQVRSGLFEMACEYTQKQMSQHFYICISDSGALKINLMDWSPNMSIFYMKTIK